MSAVGFATVTGDQAAALVDELADLYAVVYADPPYHEGRSRSGGSPASWPPRPPVRDSPC